MQLRIGLTGKPRIGKSTIIKEVIGRLKAEGIVVGGMLTADMHDGGRRVGFSIEDIRTGETGILAHVQLHRHGPTVGKYTVNLTDLDAIGAHSITSALAQSDLIVIDEIGPMELKSTRFLDAVENALSSDKQLIVTVHQRSAHELVRRIKSAFEILEVTEANRDELATVIMDRWTKHN
ncbi:MAG TPA: NTPase [Desulfobacteria bacterium]|nr:NTPase [Desulfobacteria bacterium]